MHQTFSQRSVGVISDDITSHRSAFERHAETPLTWGRLAALQEDRLRSFMSKASEHSRAINGGPVTWTMRWHDSKHLRCGREQKAQISRPVLWRDERFTRSQNIQRMTRSACDSHRNTFPVLSRGTAGMQLYLHHTWTRFTAVNRE